ASPSCELSALEASASVDLRRAVAACLTGEGRGFDPDPWAHARAAELLVSAGAFEEADAAIARALRGGSDQQVTAEIASRWFDVVAPIGGKGGLELRVKAAERSLFIGEAADAQRWCES